MTGDDRAAAKYGWGLGVWSVSTLIVATLAASTHVGDAAGVVVFGTGVVALALLEDRADDVAEWLAQTLEADDTQQRELERTLMKQMIANDAQSDVEDAREAYLDGEIDEEELEERVGDALDDFSRLNDATDEFYDRLDEDERDRDTRVMER
ncbi:hypothetical protein [Natronomonas marina]|uniref:hypothetical protein n=1 Tax=Natronomonas marina TaxID=2961939 RepID=UPI0020C94AEF|nr:hypothetical protein [Natronomonas marina]